MAGNHGSLQNDKEILGYTDDEWNYIWGTMIQNGAWAVPGIKDVYGNVIKENNAPEIFIKYIAHDLKCHLIVFDLVLDNIQFVSGNHVKANNVVFDSPLLVYSTGSHFQSVFQLDQEFFVGYARTLESELVPSLNQPEVLELLPSLEVSLDKADTALGISKRKEATTGSSRTCTAGPSRAATTDLSRKATACPDIVTTTGIRIATTSPCPSTVATMGTKVPTW